MLHASFHSHGGILVDVHDGSAVEEAALLHCSCARFLPLVVSTALARGLVHIFTVGWRIFT